MRVDHHDVRVIASGAAVVVERATGRATVVTDTRPCSWQVERTYFPDGFEVDFPSDLITECGAPTVQFDDGFACAAGHWHVSDAVYLDDDEIVPGNPATLVTGARRMDGTPV